MPTRCHHDRDAIGCKRWQPDHRGGVGNGGADHRRGGEGQRRGRLRSSGAQPLPPPGEPLRTKPRDRANASSESPLRSHSASTRWASASVQWRRGDAAEARLAMPRASRAVKRAAAPPRCYRRHSVGRSRTRRHRTSPACGHASGGLLRWCRKRQSYSYVQPRSPMDDFGSRVPCQTPRLVCSASRTVRVVPGAPWGFHFEIKRCFGGLRADAVRFRIARRGSLARPQPTTRA